MEQSGIGPNARTYTVILHYPVMFDQRAQASKEFWKMIDCGCDPDVKTHTMMVKMLFEDDELDMALKAWKHMVLKGVSRHAYLLYSYKWALGERSLGRSLCLF